MSLTVKQICTPICRVTRSLTVSAHSGRDALLEAAVLAAVAVNAQYGALLILGAGAVLNLLLDRPAEEALKVKKTLDILVGE